MVKPVMIPFACTSGSSHLGVVVVVMVNMVVLMIMMMMMILVMMIMMMKMIILMPGRRYLKVMLLGKTSIGSKLVRLPGTLSLVENDWEMGRDLLGMLMSVPAFVTTVKV